MGDEHKTQKTGIPPLGQTPKGKHKSSSRGRQPLETAPAGQMPFDEEDADSDLDDSGPTFVGDHPKPPPDSEDTAVQEYPKDPSAAQSPILIVNAPLGTKEVELHDEQIVIGRAPDCDVVIADQLVSRSHAILERLAEGWYLIDQGSGNGTFLNGKQVDKAVLYDQDVIQVGDVEITFSDPSAPRVPEGERPLPSQTAQASISTDTGGTSLTRTAGSRQLTGQKRMLVIAGGLLLFIVIAWITLRITDPSPRELTPQEMAAQKERARIKKAEASFNTVTDLVRAKKWEESAALIKEVAKVIGERKIVQDYKNTIHIELTAQKDIQQARAQIAAQDHAGAIALLLRVPAESEYSEQARELRKEVERLAREAKLTKAKQAFDQKDFQAAARLAEELLVAEPGNQEIAELKRKAEAEIAKPTPKVRKRKKKRKRVAKATPVKSKVLLSGSALAAYQQGDLEQAMAVASTSGTSAEGMTKLRRFTSLYAHGMELARNPAKSKQAEKALLQAIQLDRALGGGQGEITKKVRHKLAGVYFFRAVDAHNRKKYPEAFQGYNLALEYRPELKQANNRLKDLEKQAQKLYDTAYVIKLNNPEKATSLCKTVLLMVRKDAYAYGRCKTLLKKLQGPSSSTESDEGF